MLPFSSPLSISYPEHRTSAYSLCSRHPRCLLARWPIMKQKSLPPKNKTFKPTRLLFKNRNRDLICTRTPRLSRRFETTTFILKKKKKKLPLLFPFLFSLSDSGGPSASPFSRRYTGTKWILSVSGMPLSYDVRCDSGSCRRQNEDASQIQTEIEELQRRDQKKKCRNQDAGRL